MQISDTYSVRNAESLLQQRGALKPCLDVARYYSGRPEDHKILEDLGFEPEWQFDAGGNHPRFDAYSQKWKVGIEREIREQMNVRSHLLFVEIAYRKGLIEIGVLILPMKGQGTFGRTKREVAEYELFNRYFLLQVPLYLIGCARE